MKGYDAVRYAWESAPKLRLRLVIFLCALVGFAAATAAAIALLLPFSRPVDVAFGLFFFTGTVAAAYRGAAASPRGG